MMSIFQIRVLALTFCRVFSEYCPLLENVTSLNNDSEIYLSGYDMRFSNNLKQISMDSSRFLYFEDDIADLNNHQEIFMFHCCCKATEYVSIRNMKYPLGFFDDDDDQLNLYEMLLQLYVGFEVI
jgi:hypothetical protein